MTKFNRKIEDMGNIVALEHVNTRVPDQQQAIAFYVMGLGLTRDPFLMTGTNNMWVNVGRGQFHLPTGAPQVVRGHTGVVIPGRNNLLQRLSDVKSALSETKFAFVEHNDFVEVTCPWGNIIRCFEPGPAFGQTRLGMPYVEFNVPLGTAAPITKFYQDVMATDASLSSDDGADLASAVVGDGQVMMFRETDVELPEFDGHHIAVYLADFSGPYHKLLDRGLITQESNQHQYRFVDIFDPDSGEPVYRLEHEVRSMRHPMYARAQMNRNPDMSNRNYVPGYQEVPWAMPMSS